MGQNLLSDAMTSFAHFAPLAPVPDGNARHIPVKEAKAKLTELLRAAEAGERIVLTRHGKPVADLVPHQEMKEETPMSLLARVEAWHEANPSNKTGWVSPDFDDPLPEDFLISPWPDDVRLADDGWKQA